jgi:uncharacterized membrane protein
MKQFLFIIIPVTFAVLIRLAFGADFLNDFVDVMSWNFFTTVPAAVGALFVYFSPADKAKSIRYRILGPWVPVFLIILFTIAFQIEGWGCWIMILPLFLLFASIGGLIAGYIKTRKSKKNQNLNVSIVVLLPFLIGPIEKSIPRNPEVFTTFTAIDINADAETIWDNVTSVRKIKTAEDHSKLIDVLGFPKPLEAKLDTLAVGGSRKAVFERGLVFNETVTQYDDKKSMSFTIKANTYEIPSTTLDEHILIGGEYFDMLDGTYKLEKHDENHYRLVLYSNFSMNTTFNSYAGIWGHYIMKDIQDNILTVIKKRSETQ